MNHEIFHVYKENIRNKKGRDKSIERVRKKRNGEKRRRHGWNDKQQQTEIAFRTLPDKSTVVGSIIRDGCKEILDCKKKKEIALSIFRRKQFFFCVYRDL